MAPRLRSFRTRARVRGLPRGIFKQVIAKLLKAKHLPGKGARVRVIVRRARPLLPTKHNYERLFREAHPNLPRTWPVHHSLPQKYVDIMRRAGINIHENRYLRGVHPDVHPKITGLWVRWDNALRGRTPTAAEVIAFAERIDRTFARFFVR